MRILMRDIDLALPYILQGAHGLQKTSYYAVYERLYSVRVESLWSFFLTNSWEG